MSDAFIEGLGAELARARDVMGMSQADVANRLKLSVRQIEALESEDWAHLPGEVFRRGFVRNYARVVELNPDDLIRPVDAAATATQTITAPSEGLAIGRSPIARWVAIPLVGLALFMLVVAVLYQWLSQGEQTLLTPSGPLDSVAPAAPPASGSMPATGQAETQTVVQPLMLDPQAISVIPAAPKTVEPREATTGTAPAAVQEPTPTSAPTPVTTPATQAPPAQPATPPGKPTATLKFSPGEDAWIQVVDGQGQRFSKLVRSGAQEQLSGVPPFKLVVGNAALVKVTYNGHQIDLKPFIGEKVARLTLE